MSCSFFKNFFLFAISLFLIFFVNIVQAAGEQSCDTKTLESSLTSLRLSPTLRSNKILTQHIRLLYGEAFVDELIERHPALEGEPKGRIDAKTLEWVKRVGFTGNSTIGVQYVISPFQADVDYGAAFLIERLIFAMRDGYPNYVLVKPAFLSMAQFRSVRDLFHDDGNFGFVVEILKGIYDESDIAILEKAKRMYKSIFTDINGYVKHSNLSLLSKRTVLIIGHGKPGRETISFELKGHGKSELHFSKVIEIINKLPSDTDLYLATCGAGMGPQSQENTGKTKDELIHLFKSGGLKKSVIGDEKLSYAYKFAQELYNKRDGFTGKILAPIGASTFMSQTKAWSRYRQKDNSYKVAIKNQLGIFLKDLNDKHVVFDRSAMLAIYTKNDFISLYSNLPMERYDLK